MKPRYFLVFFFVLAALFLTLFLFIKMNQKQNNWQFFIQEQVGAKSVLNIGRNLTFDEKNLYFGDGKGLIHALDKESGRVGWSKQLNDHSPFEITQDEEALYIANFDSHIYKLDKKNGYTVWSFAIPDQFWPDTEVVFDVNDNAVFFADRGGFLYALDKTSGQQIWRKDFGTVDNTKTFKEGSIHFGFLKQNDEQIIIDHFPKSKRYIISKQTGEILSEEVIDPKIEIGKERHSLQFSSHDLQIEQNVANQPKLNLFDKEQKLIWSYQIEQKTNLKEVYQNEDRIYYFDANNQLLSSIKISDSNPNKEKLRKINFKIKEDYSKHQPFEKNPNPQITYEEVANWLVKIRRNWLFLEYFFSNLQQIKNFNLRTEEKESYLEFSIFHQENFYQNVFTDVLIEAEFRNQNNEKIVVKGFYYDYNLWKIRAKLHKGLWRWQVKIKTPFWTNNQSGEIEIKNDSMGGIKIQDGSFIDQENKIFMPVGLQDVTNDHNMDGNPLNQIGYAKTAAPPENKEDYSYLNFSDYLDLYKNEADINIFRYGPDNWAPSIWKNLDKIQDFAMNVNGNLQGDAIVGEAQKRNIRIMMSIFAFYPPYASKEAVSKKENQQIISKYLDYIVSRYASNIDIWELSNEALPSQEWQDFVSDYLAKNDPYNHPITTSLENYNLRNSNLLSIHLYTHPKNNLELIEQVEKLLQKPREQSWPGAIMISELGFSDANYFAESADLMRKMTWILAFKKVGVIFWNTGDSLIENNGSSNIYLGPTERIYLKELGNFLSNLKLPIKNSFEITNNDQLAVYKLENKQLKLIYLVNLNSQKNNSLELTIDVEDSSLVEIVDPKNNKLIKQIKIEKDLKKITLPYFAEDLAIKISKV